MKTTKRTEITVETFERMVISFKQNLSNIYCADCQKQIFELPVNEIVFAQKISDAENAYIFITKNGLCLVMKTD